MIHRVSWLDWVCLVLLLGFTIRGLLRGTIAQVFAFFGLVFGVFAFLWVSQWIGEHWHGARPALVFLALRWVVAALGGMAIAALFQWWGDLVAKSAHDGPFGWLDRLVGGAVGLAFGLVIASVLLLLAIQAPVLAFARHSAAHGVVARPLIQGGRRLTALEPGVVPGGRWLHGQFVAAAERIGATR